MSQNFTQVLGAAFSRLLMLWVVFLASFNQWTFPFCFRVAAPLMDWFQNSIILDIN